MSTTEEPHHSRLSPLLIDGPPWEKKHEIGFFVGFVETLKAFLLYPAKTFSVMRRAAGVGDALVYTVAIQVFTFLWMYTISDADPTQLLLQNPALQDMLQLPDNFSQIVVLLYPLSVILLQFVLAYAIHLALKWRDLQSYDFPLVFRIYAYSSGTAAILLLVPALGGILSLFMTIYLCYMGLRTVYGLSAGSLGLIALSTVLITIGLYIIVIVGTTIVLVFLSLFI